MSITIHEDHITLEQLETIRKLLYIVPKKGFNNFIPNKALYFKLKKQMEENPTDPIFLYNINQNTNLITLPYFFARSLLNLPIPNYHPKFPFSFTKQLFESQVDIVHDAWKQLQTYGTTTLNLHTGAGKTVDAAFLASITGNITLVIVTSGTVGVQWSKTFQDFTNANIWYVELNKPPPNEIAQVIICQDTRFKLLPPNYLKYIGTVIYDEAHTLCTPERIKCILGVQPQYVIAATATLNRQDGLHSIIEATCGTHKIVKISKKPFIVYKYNTGINIEIKLNAMGTPDWSKVTLDQAMSPHRNWLIHHIISQHMNDKVLVLTWRAKDHAIPLAKWLKESGHNVDYMAGTKKSYSDSHVLVGTIKKIGTGFDEKTACENFNGQRINILILAGSTRQVELLEQIAGRAFRSDFPIIYHLVDNCSISKNHWKISVPWYKSRNGQIIEKNSPYVDTQQINIGNFKHDADSIMDEQLKRYRENPPI